MAVAGLVLAAGAARRFGAQKLTALLDGEPVVRWSVAGLLAAGMDEVVVVLGRESGAVREATRGLSVRCVENPRFADGLAGSLRVGIEALPDETRAVVIALGDQPRVPVEVPRALVERFERTGGPIVVPVYQGVRGNPVLIAASLFPELLALRGDEGARGVIARDPSRVHGVSFSFAVPADVDTPADLAALAGGPLAPPPVSD